MSTQATGHVFTVRRKRGEQFYAKYRTPQGRQIQKRLGPAWLKRTRPPAGFLTRAMAEARLHELLDDAEHGRAVAASTRSFADACEEFLRHREHDQGCAESTMRDYEWIVAQVLKPEFGADTPLEAIDEDRVREFRDTVRSRRGVAPATARKHMVTLSGVMDRARRRKWIAVNPCADVEPIRIPKASGKFKALSPVQAMALGRAAACDQDAALYVVAAFTGLRQGELRALRWGDIDFAQSFIHVQHNQPAKTRTAKLPKSGKVRSVPLIPQAAKALDDLSRRETFTGPDDLVFVNTFGGALHDDTIRKEWVDAMDRAGLSHLRADTLPRADRFTFHDLRHSFGTLAVRMWPLSDVQGYMGHANIATTMIYVHHTPRTEAAAQLGSLVARELGEVAEELARAIT